ncbi:Piso0_000295 [Millerozyma farinosa CBS 7064]|uniref:Piso0_000295 protein n=1 Tax=Pichia sorbitophila (strain ATCC MYA-4447 / BCRC 22081 / CBS 7064 / NBRC 10061 / NRRL Y-12695) TaxID=559304 RepID=G8YTL4_PICSO|nr:Piso0_000295 [Millerozyma farinosa CBS 7064]
MDETAELEPKNPIIVVGGGLAGLSAAHEVYLRGGNVILLDKQGFLSGNSGKATSGINGALTRTQIDLSIKDSVQQFYDDTLKTAKDRANPELIKVLTYNSADAVHWLQDVFGLDLSIVSRLGGHSQPRTHRGKDAKFPGMAITYKLLEKLEDLASTEPHRVHIKKKSQVIDLLKSEEDPLYVYGVKYKDLTNKSKHELHGPVIMSTGGYAADFTKNSLLRKYRPDIIDLPSTNGSHATGDGHKIILKNKGIGIDMDKVQVHPTGLIDINDQEVISGKKSPRFLFLGAEALRGEGGIILNDKGERFVDELGTRDYVSGEMEKQMKAGNGPLRLVLNAKSESKLQFHVKHYKQRNLTKTITGTELAKEIGCSTDVIAKQLELYDKAAKGEIEDPYGKKYFPNSPFEFNPDDQYHVSYITRVLHFTMGGVKINDKSQVLFGDDNPFRGLYAAGEVAGGVHGHNRLGGSSLLACVVYGRVAADQASNFLLQVLSKDFGGTSEPQSKNVPDASSSAAQRLKQIHLHIDPSSSKIVIEIDGDSKSSSAADHAINEPSKPAPQEAQKSQPKSQPKQEKSKNQEKPSNDKAIFPSKEFTAEDVAKHNKKDDCWVIIKNAVLDVTHFLKDHPGGEESILNFAGKDATESFDMLHEDNVIVRYAKDCVVGKLKGKTPYFKF